MTESKPKIIYAITKGNFGGAQKYVYQLAYQAKNEGYLVSVLYGSNGLLEKKLNSANIPTIKIDSIQRDVNIFKEINSFLEILKILKRERPDIIHLNSSKMGSIGALASRLAGIKNIIFTIHGWAFNEKRNILSKIAIKLIYSFTLILCHKIILVSESVEDQLKDLPFNKLFSHKAIVIKTAIPNPLFLPKEEAREAISRITKTNLDDKVIVGSIAELHKVKGLNYAIEAISYLNKDHKNILYVIIGEGDERKNLERQIERLGLKNKVILLGFQADASKYIKAFDIFLFPSISEAYGLVLIESAYANVPIIASNVGGIKEIVEDKKTGILIHPENTIEIAHSVNHLLHHKEIAKQYANNLKKKIISKNNLLKFYKETFSLYS